MVPINLNTDTLNISCATKELAFRFAVNRVGVHLTGVIASFEKTSSAGSSKPTYYVSKDQTSPLMNDVARHDDSPLGSCERCMACTFSSLPSKHGMNLFACSVQTSTSRPVGPFPILAIQGTQPQLRDRTDQRTAL